MHLFTWEDTTRICVYYTSVARIEVLRFRYTVTTEYYTFVYFFPEFWGWLYFRKTLYILFFVCVYYIYFHVLFYFSPSYTPEMQGNYMIVFYLYVQECPYRVKRIPCTCSYYAYSEYRMPNTV